MNCIYCGKSIINPSKEHIIQSSMGSNLHSFLIICPDCNNYFARSESGKIDDEISEQFKTFRNLFNISGDRGNTPPILRNISTKTGKVMNLAPGGSPVLTKSKREETTNSDGEMEITIVSPNTEKIKEQIAHLKKQYGDDKVILNSANMINEFIDDPFHMTLTFGGKNGLKAILKNVYNFLFYIQRDKKIDLNLDIDDFIPLRNYLRHNIKTDEVYASLDYKNTPPIEIRNDDISNIIIVAGSSLTNLIYGYFIGFGHIHFTCVLKSDYTGKNFCFCYKQNPQTFDKEFFSDIQQLPFNSDITKNYLLHAKDYHPITQEKASNLMKLYFDYIGSELISEMIDEVMNETFPEDGEIILPEHTKDFANKIADRFVRLMNRVPSQKDISDEFK